MFVDIEVQKHIDAGEYDRSIRSRRPSPFSETYILLTLSCGHVQCALEMSEPWPASWPCRQCAVRDQEKYPKAPLKYTGPSELECFRFRQEMTVRRLRGETTDD